MIHVFVGPTLPPADASLSAPGVRVRPPVRHGDLFDAGIRPGDTVLVVDGVYHQSPALRHQEILAAIGRGIRVIGAASIGALRAAELASFGMLGVGSIYTAYARGDIDGDDEVAVGQAPDGPLDALTWPVVNVRHALELAGAAGVLDGGRAAGLLAALRAVYYPQRTTAAVRAICRRLDEREFASWLAEQRTRDPFFGDLKRADALAAVRMALAAPAAPACILPLAAVPETTYFRRWSNAFARQTVDGVELLTEDRVVYQQMFDPAFAETWAAYLEHCSRHPRDGSPALPVSARLAKVTGGDLSADQVFHPVVDLRDEVTVRLLLAGETPQDRQAVTRYASALVDARRARPGFSTAAVRGDLTRRVLLRVWECPEERLDAEASARGLVSAARAVDAVKRLIPGYLNETTKQEAVSGAR